MASAAPSSAPPPPPAVVDRTPESSFSAHDLPVWADDAHLDPGWVASKTALPCTSCRVEDRSDATRARDRLRDCATLLLTLTLAGRPQAEGDGDDDDNKATKGEETMTLILKQVSEPSRPLSLRLGLAREGIAYEQLAHLREGAFCCPKVYYAYGNVTTGDKVVIMEHLSDAIDSAAFFGPGSPHNWKKDLAALTSRAPGVTDVHVARMTFVAAAKIHARHWTDPALLGDDKAWLRGQEWVRGRNRESWEAAQELARASWSRSESGSDPCGKIAWDAALRGCVQKAVDGISWEAQRKRLHADGIWTLVHGDFWPGNVMYLVDENDIRLLDWEMCGLGSGPQDLGQYVISNMKPEVRRKHEKELVEAYHRELVRCGVRVSWEHVWDEYRVGGMERWMWFLAYFLGLAGFQDWAQFFHDQMASFLHDHGLTEQDFTQIRP